MTIAIYVIMVLAVFAMIWGNQQYKSKGVPWGRPLAGLCGIIALAFAFLAIGIHFWGDHFLHAGLQAKECKYQYVAYKFFGRHLARNHAGKRILLIRYPAARRGGGKKLNDAKMKGLTDGFAGKLEINETEEIGGFGGMGGPGGPGGPGGMGPPMMMEAEYMLTAEKFDDIIEEHSECTLVISLVGLPYDLQEMTLWDLDEDERPALALANAHIFELRRAIKAGLITCVLENKPEVYDWKARVPSEENIAFERRFLLIDPETVDSAAAKYSTLFKKED